MAGAFFTCISAGTADMVSLFRLVRFHYMPKVCPSSPLVDCTSRNALTFASLSPIGGKRLPPPNTTIKHLQNFPNSNSSYASRGEVPKAEGVAFTILPQTPYPAQTINPSPVYRSLSLGYASPEGEKPNPLRNRLPFPI